MINKLRHLQKDWIQLMICIFIHWELESPHFGSLLKIGGLDIIFLGMSTYLFSIYLYEEIDSALGATS